MSARYTSQLFRAARAYCEATYDRWLVLSALHGLVDPDQIIEPYDVTLNRMLPSERREWALKVEVQIEAFEVGLARRVYVHAGRLYREAFNPLAVVVPLGGLGIGEQLGWYAARARERAS